MNLDTVLASNFDQNVEIAQRKFDGKWNMWVREVFVGDDPEEITWAWSVINVLDTKEQATKERETFRAQVARAKAA